jgi:hypothetical protein
MIECINSINEDSDNLYLDVWEEGEKLFKYLEYVKRNNTLKEMIELIEKLHTLKESNKPDRTPEDQLKEAENYRPNTFITFYETEKASLGGNVWFSYGVKLKKQDNEIEWFFTAEEAIKFYNENNK